jgi:hypothetical protein
MGRQSINSRHAHTFNAAYSVIDIHTFNAAYSVIDIHTFNAAYSVIDIYSQQERGST